jgi:hypothetical protein
MRENWEGNKIMKKFILSSAISLLLPVTANATPVDLTGWGENGFKGNDGAGTWVVQPGNDSVLQTINGDPTVFFEAGSNAQGTALSGTIEVETTSDDDFIGFVLGYQDGEFNSVNADFWLIDWKQLDQTFGGKLATKGLALSHVTGDVAGGPSANDSVWDHTNTVNEVARGTNLSSTGWNDNQNYVFKLTFTDSVIEVFVDNVLEISHAGTFTDGAFGFYNYSHNQVRYAGIASATLPPPGPSIVPLPASLPLLLAGFGFLVLARRRKS